MNTPGKYKEAYKFGDSANFITSVVFFSPIVLVCISVYIITSYNSKALIFYVLFLIIGLFVRTIFVNSESKKHKVNTLDNSICSAIYYKTYYGSLTISLFIFGYSFMYFLLPMIINYYTHSSSNSGNENSINYILIVLFVGYILLDIMVKKYYNCYTINNVSNLLSSYELFSGALVGSMVIVFLYSINLSNYIYYYPFVNKQTVCQMVNNNTYGCFSN
jgi:hypothetical protein